MEKLPTLKKHFSEYERVFNVKLENSDLETLNNKINQIKLRKPSDIDASPANGQVSPGYH